MKETIQQKLKTLLEDIKERRVILEKQEKEYRNTGDYSRALYRQSANSALSQVESRIEDILNR